MESQIEANKGGNLSRRSSSRSLVKVVASSISRTWKLRFSSLVLSDPVNCQDKVVKA